MWTRTFLPKCHTIHHMGKYKVFRQKIGAIIQVDDRKQTKKFTYFFARHRVLHLISFLLWRIFFSCDGRTKLFRIMSLKKDFRLNKCHHNAVLVPADRHLTRHFFGLKRSAFKRKFCLLVEDAIIPQGGSDHLLFLHDFE